MFTGIVVSTGLFKGYRKSRHEMQLEAADLAPKLDPGASLSVNGVCLSLVSKDNGTLAFGLSQETLGRTNLGALRPGARLNLELPLTLGSLVSGHLVSGHIDAVGRVVRLVEKRPGKRLLISFPSDLRPYFVPKGSEAVNGVSLTIAALGAATLEAELIPLTLKGTNLGGLRSGDPVNLECDMVGKYAYNWFMAGRNRR